MPTEHTLGSITVEREQRTAGQAGNGTIIAEADGLNRHTPEWPLGVSYKVQ